MFAKGLIYGLVIIALNFLILFLTIKYFLTKTKKFVSFTFFLFYLLRYAILGVLVYAFLKHRWGSPLGLLAGISIGLLVFMILRRTYHDSFTGSS